MKTITKAEAKRRIVRARGIQTIEFSFWSEPRQEWIATRPNDPYWRRLDEIRGTSLKVGGSWLDLDSKTKVFEIDETTVVFEWHHESGKPLSRSTASLVPRDNF
jgi:hypothetical protein